MRVCQLTRQKKKKKKILIDPWVEVANPSIGMLCGNMIYECNIFFSSLAQEATLFPFGSKD